MAVFRFQNGTKREFLMAYQLHRYNVRKQTVVKRRVNRGAEITDNLPTLKIKPDDLNMYSEVDPVTEGVGGFGDKFWLLVSLEIPKWWKYRRLYGYGWRILWAMLRMNYGQWFDNFFVSRKKETDLNRLKQEIKEFAAAQGYISGVTLLDRRFLAEANDDTMPYDNILMLGMEMDKALVDEIPNQLRKLCDFEIYIKSGIRIYKVAKFIRSKGYRCFVRTPTDFWIKYPPHAINAGLGELGAQGVVITPQYGPRQRWGMIGIDADIEIDQPVDLGMAEYCDACKICIKACPGKAISEERLWWRGVYKRKIIDNQCYPYFKKYYGCGICIKVCPINQYGYEACMDAFRKEGKIHRSESS
jgi:ferredoxin